MRRVRVALVSTYPPAQCGIGNYSEQLVMALGAQAPDIDVRVLAERGAGDSTAAVRRVWHRREEWPRELLESIEALAPEVVHVQHEESIFGEDFRLPMLVFALRSRGIRTVVTLHSVYDTRRARAFHDGLRAHGAELVIHQRAGAESLGSSVLIPHGTPPPPALSREAARARLGLPGDGPIVLFFGFIHYSKRVHVALAAFQRAAIANSRFVVAGRLRRAYTLDPFYAWWIERRLRGDARVIYRPGFVPVEDKPAYYAAADLVVLPHRQRYGSASGVLHEALAARRPIACSNGLKFAELVERLAPVVPEACPRAGDVAGWQRALECLLGDDTARARSLAVIEQLADETSWANAAAAHATLYRALAVRAAA
jgi:glycosyltransferase involved in cell wall biosynthesis